MSSFVKHTSCKEVCQNTLHDGVKCGVFCIWPDAYEEEPRPIFEQRDTDQEAKLDRRERARECK